MGRVLCRSEGMTMSEEIDIWMGKYFEAFGEGFPTFQLLRSRTDEEGIELIKQCLDAGKDAYALGLVTDDPEVVY